MVVSFAEEGNALAAPRDLQPMKRWKTCPLWLLRRVGKENNRNKIMNGIVKACEKRPISIKQIEDIVDCIEKEVYQSLDREVSSQFIGEMIMTKLKEVDEVAYVRFASVYRQFKDINTFMAELNKLLKDE